MLKEHVQSMGSLEVLLYLLKLAGDCLNYGTQIGWKLIGVLNQQQGSRVSLKALT